MTDDRPLTRRLHWSLSMSSTDAHTVRFEPWGTAVECSADAVSSRRRPPGRDPGRRACAADSGTCGKCQVRILTGAGPAAGRHRNQPSVAAECARAGLPAGVYATRWIGDLTVEILPIISHGKGEAPPLDAVVRARPPRCAALDATLEPPSLDRPVGRRELTCCRDGRGRADRNRRGGLPDRAILPETLRAADWHVAVSIRSSQSESSLQAVAVVAPRDRLKPRLQNDARYLSGRRGRRRPPCRTWPHRGLAVDLGTTNLAAYLYRMDNGELLEVLVPPTRCPAMARTSWRGLPSPIAPRKRENAAAGAGQDGEPADRPPQSGRGTPADIDEMVVVGNSGMHHLFLDLPARQSSMRRMCPRHGPAMSIKARDLGIDMAAGGYVYMPPLVGGFVGSDLLAVALATRMERAPGSALRWTSAPTPSFSSPWTACCTAARRPAGRP